MAQCKKKKENPSVNAEDASLIPGLGRIPGRGHGNPLQCSSLGNPTDRGGWRATAYRATTGSDVALASKTTSYSAQLCPQHPSPLPTNPANSINNLAVSKGPLGGTVAPTENRGSVSPSSALGKR